MPASRTPSLAPSLWTNSLESFPLGDNLKKDLSHQLGHIYSWMGHLHLLDDDTRPFLLNVLPLCLAPFRHVLPSTKFRPRQAKSNDKRNLSFFCRSSWKLTTKLKTRIVSTAQSSELYRFQLLNKLASVNILAEMNISHDTAYIWF